MQAAPGKCTDKIVSRHKLLQIPRTGSGEADCHLFDVLHGMKAKGNRRAELSRRRAFLQKIDAPFGPFPQTARSFASFRCRYFFQSCRCEMLRPGSAPELVLSDPGGSTTIEPVWSLRERSA